MASIYLTKHWQHVPHRVCGIRFILKINSDYFQEYLSLLEGTVFEIFILW